MVTQITTVEQFDQAIKAEKLVVVDFYSLTCGPCKMIAPIVEKFAAQYTEADFYKVDCDELGAAAQSNNISALPTFVFFKGGKEITRVIGANPSGVKSTIAANL
ncbi:thioredoxin trx1 [Hanseniaspora vineae]